MSAIFDQNGGTQQIPLDVSMYRVAADNSLSFEQYVNKKYKTDPNKYGTAFNQLLASEGIFIRPDREYGIRASSMDEILNGRGRMEAGVIVKDAVPASRILFPAAILSAVEDKLNPNLDINPNAFEKLIAMDDTIQGDRYEQPVLNFSKPEQHRSQGISQLALPNAMLSITVSDVSRKIPTFSMGMEISDQAMKASSLDLVALALARQASVERNERTNEHILALLNGDTDVGQAALTGSKIMRANQFDAGVTTAGTLSQKAWIKYLYNNATRRTVTHIITDLDGAMAVEARTGKPVITGDNPNSPRIDTLQTIMNPAWPASVQFFITSDSNWPANTLLGFDVRYAIHRVTSLNASYEAIEQYVLKRSTAMRFDHGVITQRLFDDAFDVLSLALS